MVMRQPGTRSQERTFSAASIIRLVLLMFRSVYYDRTAQLQLARPPVPFSGSISPQVGSDRRGSRMPRPDRIGGGIARAAGMLVEESANLEQCIGAGGGERGAAERLDRRCDVRTEQDRFAFR